MTTPEDAAVLTRAQQWLEVATWVFGKSDQPFSGWGNQLVLPIDLIRNLVACCTRLQGERLRFVGMLRQQHPCAVCGWPRPYDNEHNICECCGFQEGYEQPDAYKAAWDGQWWDEDTPPQIVKALQERAEQAEAALTRMRERLQSDQLRLYHQHDCELKRYGSEKVKEQGHVCGLQGFGALGDVCPACEGPFTYRTAACTCGLRTLLEADAVSPSLRPPFGAK